MQCYCDKFTVAFSADLDLVSTSSANPFSNKSLINI
jgi:hypothetical protein